MNETGHAVMRRELSSSTNAVPIKIIFKSAVYENVRCQVPEAGPKIILF